MCQSSLPKSYKCRAPVVLSRQVTGWSILSKLRYYVKCALLYSLQTLPFGPASWSLAVSRSSGRPVGAFSSTAAAYDDRLNVGAWSLASSMTSSTSTDPERPRGSPRSSATTISWNRSTVSRSRPSASTRRRRAAQPTDWASAVRVT